MLRLNHFQNNIKQEDHYSPSDGNCKYKKENNKCQFKTSFNFQYLLSLLVLEYLVSEIKMLISVKINFNSDKKEMSCSYYLTDMAVLSFRPIFTMVTHVAAQ